MYQCYKVDFIIGATSNADFRLELDLIKGEGQARASYYVMVEVVDPVVD
jgi:hypothetical protein